MNYSIIGTGNIALFFAKRLKEAGHNCTGIYGRNARIANALAKEVYADDCGSITDAKDNADICILAVSDAAIAEMAKQIHINKTVLVHTAGSVNINVLKDSAIDYGVIWPVYSIIKADLPLHRQIPMAWEASSDKARQQIVSLISSISDQPFEAKDEQRRWLHLAAVMGNNFINHLMAICEQICNEQAVPFSILQPILQQTFDRVKQHSPAELQTGPAKRNDQTTMDKHVDILKSHPEWKDIYESLSRSIGKMHYKG